MQTQLQDHARNAGCICFGTRIIRTSPLAGCALYKNSNQFIFNLAGVNLPNFVLETDSLAENTTKITKGLVLMLVSSHKVTNLIFDVSLLVDQRIPCESIVEMIRDALVETDYQCDTVTILWSPSIR